MLIGMKATMWKDVFVARANDRANPTYMNDPAMVAVRYRDHRRRALASAMEKWQEAWEASDPGNWD